MSSPRLPPRLMPETMRSGLRSSSPSAAMRTQSTGVPSVRRRGCRRASSTSSTHRGACMVMLRAAPERFWSGATMRTSPSGSSAVLSAASPGERHAVVVGENDQGTRGAEGDERAVPTRHVHARQTCWLRRRAGRGYALSWLPEPRASPRTTKRSQAWLPLPLPLPLSDELPTRRGGAAAARDLLPPADMVLCRRSRWCRSRCP